jgi:hypothetical protein
MRGNSVANESISASFDPAKMICICCIREHPVINSSPIVVMFSDQNFVPTLAGNNETCIHVVRLKNATLHELGNLAN